MCRFIRIGWITAFLAVLLSPFAHSLEKQSTSIYHARRVALGAKLQGGVAILFAAPEPVLDFMPYRQDSDFYYLTGWNEPGAALLVVGTGVESQGYKEILFLPTRDLRLETYTGAKMDASSPGAAAATGVDVVEPMTELPAALNALDAAGCAASPRAGELYRDHAGHGRATRGPRRDDADYAAPRIQGCRRN